MKSSSNQSLAALLIGILHGVAGTGRISYTANLILNTRYILVSCFCFETLHHIFLLYFGLFLRFEYIHSLILYEKYLLFKLRICLYDYRRSARRYARTRNEKLPCSLYLFRSN